LNFYPELRDNIVVFDDNSTDGTREWLESKHIKIINWNYYKQQIEELLDINKSGTLHKSCVSHSYMIKELLQQVITKYLFVID
jgi:glycosyltransferase involved in cell wall biosynthesis